MAFRFLLTCLFLTLTSYQLCNGAPNEDLVTDLPGLNYTINFKQYSGYLDGGLGKKLHYWFLESQNDPANDPIVLWLNGGPGCSSLFGLLGENGPFRIADDGFTVQDNPSSWNKVANMVYLESPAAVGYSYNTQGEDSEDDDSTSLQNYEALKDFFTTKFPEYAQNEFYITGESYGGIYIPTLVVRILNDTNNLNLKGFLIGNGYLYPDLLDITQIFFIGYHGLTGINEWNNYVATCCSNGIPNDQTCRSLGPIAANDACDDAMDALYDTMGSLDWYNIYHDGPSPLKAAHLKTMRHEIKHMMTNHPAELKYKLLEQVNKRAANLKDGLDDWMNRDDVRKALHIPDTLGSWIQCGGPFYSRLYDTMLPQVDFATSKIRGVIYNGDVDLMCNYLGDQQFVENLNREVLNDYHPWTGGDYTTGYAKQFRNITFVSVKGAGHMVPSDKPGPALQMFTAFIKNQDL